MTRYCCSTELDIECRKMSRITDRSTVVGCNRTGCFPTRLLVTLFDEYPVVTVGDFSERNPSWCSAAVMEYVSSSLVRIPAFISDSSFFIPVSITIRFSR